MDGGDGFEVEPDNCPGSESVSTIGINGELPWIRRSRFPMAYNVSLYGYCGNRWAFTSIFCHIFIAQARKLLLSTLRLKIRRSS